MGSIVSLLLFFSLAVWEDCHKKRISNLLIFMALVSAFLYQFRQNGFQSIKSSFFHAGFILLILFPLYLFQALGAGDLKLLGVTAVFLSWRMALLAFIFGIYLALIPSVILLLSGKGRKSKIPMSCPILGGILIVLYKEGCI